MIDHTRRRVSAGTAGGFDVWTASAAEEGPNVVVLGGIHGDETQGVLAAGRLAIDDDPIDPRQRRDRADLSRGRILRRQSHQRHRWRQPGSGLSGRLERQCDRPDCAHHLFTEVLSGADLLIDLHTSGQDYDMPFLAGYQADTITADSLAKRAASVFGADFLWRHPGRTEGRSVSVVDQAIYVECPGGGPVSAASVDAYVAGVRRVLAMMDMVAGAPPDPATAPIGVTGGGDLDRDMISVRHEGQFLTDLAGGAQGRSRSTAGNGRHDRRAGTRRGARPRRRLGDGDQETPTGGPATISSSAWPPLTAKPESTDWLLVGAGFPGRCRVGSLRVWSGCWGVFEGVLG